jgi:hypothetical protein
MVAFMSNHRAKGWREEETLEAAARRLWRDWDERLAKKKAEEALQSSSKIQGSCVSLQEGERPEASALGFAQTSGRQHAAEGGQGSDHTADRGISDGLVTGGVSGLLRARCGVAIRPPAQPCAGSNGDGFTVEAEGNARNVRDGK